jgi:signal transduction histidine kinase
VVRLPRIARDVLRRLSAPRVSLQRGVRLAGNAPALTIAERQHIERVLGAGRVALCAAALATLSSDPAWKNSLGQLALAGIAAYLLFGVFALVAASPGRTFVLPPRIAHAIDFTAAAAVTLVTDTLPSGPLFLFFLFPLLGAAYRWGLRETLLTAVMAAVTMTAQGALGTLPLNVSLMRSAYLMVAGVLVGCLAETERQRRARVSVVAAALSRLHTETSLHTAMRETSRGILALFGAERLLAAVHDPSTGASYVWTARAQESRTELRVREIAHERAHYFFSAPGDAWAMRRDARREEHRASVIGDRGQWIGDRQVRVPAAIWEDSNATALAAVEVHFAGQGSGRVFLLRSHRLGASELAFFRELICRIAPAMFSLYLMRRVRARVTAAERARVARELHDGIIQALAGLRFDVAALRRHADRGLPIEAELARLEHALAEQTVAARELMHRVRPVDVTPRQLPGYLGSIVERFARETGIPAHYHTDVEQTDLSPRTCRELARTLQEALVNVRKHSAARHVIVRFSADPIHYRLTIDNDGRPFEFAGRLTLAELEAARRGPLVIKERVREMGGELVIESSAERGVRLDILLRRRIRIGSSKTA